MNGLFAHPRSLAALSAGRDRLVGLSIALSAGLLVAGWLLPLMTVEKMFLISDEFSIVDSIVELFEAGEVFLCVLILVFTIVFPVIKLVSAFAMWYRADASRPGFDRWLHRIDAMGRWSMLDVFVVALLVVTIKVSWVSDVQVHGGIYVFTAAVVLSMWSVRRVLNAGRARKTD